MYFFPFFNLGKTTFMFSNSAESFNDIGFEYTKALSL